MAAAVQGRLDELLDDGVLLIESTESAGAGAFAGYTIRANSLGSAFLECLEGRAGKELLAGLEHTPEAEALRARADEYPPLPAVAPFLALVGRRVVEALRAHPRCDAILGHEVREVQVAPDGVRVRFTAPGGAPREAVGERALIAMGGRERVEVPGGAVARLAAARPGLAVLPSAEAIGGPLLSAGAVDSPYRDVRRVSVLGGAHSAWAVAAQLAVLARDGWFRHDVAVRVLERRDPPIFYSSEEEARADGYAFASDRDVCPLSGRVHRFAGLRGPARELARRILDLDAEAAPAGFDSRTVPGPWTADSLAAAVPADTGLLITALGYDARLPRLTESQDATPLRLARRAGAVDSGADATPLLESGAPVRRLVTYGLGAGLVPHDGIGGEPGYTGRLDGLWIYQHDVGAVVLDTLLSTRT
ncbi:FrbG [Streptomyces parvus]|uniref:FrbG n=1 Tax=Streptomyces parvus TaxID=66428 RepID=UPI0035DF5BEB